MCIWNGDQRKTEINNQRSSTMYIQRTSKVSFYHTIVCTYNDTTFCTFNQWQHIRAKMHRKKILSYNHTTVWRSQKFVNLLLSIHKIAESICTHYSNLSGRPDIFLGSWTFKKSGTQLFAKSRVQKNRVIVIQNEKRPGCLFSFCITLIWFFAPCFFSRHKIYTTLCNCFKISTVKWDEIIFEGVSTDSF